MKLRALLVIISLLIGLVGSVLADEDTRLSKSFATADFSATGLQKLSLDQVAILDALARRDEAATLTAAPTHPRAALFSQRLSAEERANTGFNLLTTAEIARIDAQVARLENHNAPASVDTDSSGGSVAQAATPACKALPKVHGSFSLFYGTGSRGYSTQGASVDLVYHDPDHGYTITAGYAEIRTKGRLVRRACPGAYSPADSPVGARPFPQ
jgi:hypothetical protein